MQKRVFEQEYTVLGTFLRIKDKSPSHPYKGLIYQEVMSRNARGQVLKTAYGNGVIERKHYQSATGWLKRIEQKKSAKILSQQTFDFNLAGDLIQRSQKWDGGAQNTCETLTYDTQRRLSERSFYAGKNHCQGTALKQRYHYDTLGNITYKQGTGHYRYQSSHSNRLTSMQGEHGTRHYTMAYDARGNILSDGTRQWRYTVFDQAARIQKGSDYTELKYGASRQLIERIEHTVQGMSRMQWFSSGYARLTTAQGIIEHHFKVGNATIVDRLSKAHKRSHHVWYAHTDHLGSTTLLTNKKGGVVQRLTYDPWGKRVALSASTHQIGGLRLQSPAESKGFTGHTMLSNMGIIHMKGRIYDPTLGRFLQADPFIQSPTDSQSFNRYSYVLNNPLSYTDPSGYFFKHLKTFVKKYWKVIVAAIVTYVTAGAASGWAVSWGYAAGTVGNAVAAGFIAGASGGFIGGVLQTGSLRTGFKGALVGSIAGAAGGYSNFGSVTGFGDAAGRVGMSTLGGCASGKASGGSCRKGAKNSGKMQAITLGASELYKTLSIKYNKSGKPHFFISDDHKSNVGKEIKNENLLKKIQSGQTPAPLLSDQSDFMKTLGELPFFDAFSEMHDGLHDLSFIPGDQASLIITMAPSYAITLVAAMQPYSDFYALYLTAENNE
jgi:RHS repeat-associated protein